VLPESSREERGLDPLDGAESFLSLSRSVWTSSCTIARHFKILVLDSIAARTPATFDAFLDLHVMGSKVMAQNQGVDQAGNSYIERLPAAFLDKLFQGQWLPILGLSYSSRFG
jgi:hypothetical protein